MQDKSLNPLIHNMKNRRILLGLLGLAGWLATWAQAPLTWHTNPNFGHGYPMVTSMRNWYVYPVQQEDGEEQMPIGIFDFIIKVNGKDVQKENGLDEFNKSDVVTVEYLTWPGEETDTFTFFNGLYNDQHEVGDLRNMSPAKVVPLYKHQLPGMSIVKSRNVDFADFRTYDFLIEGNDPLVDEELLDEFMNGVLTQRMTRDTENPDVIFRIAKSTDQSFSATYVPPTQQVVGSTTTLRPVYNYITRTTSYEARQKLNTIEKSGRTEVTNVANVFLEVVALDAKKLNDPNQTVPPEIWKMTYSSNEVNDKRSDLKRYKDILAMCVYPFTKPAAFMIGAPLFIGADLESTGDSKALKVNGVAPGSLASELGLLPGDKIIKINGKNEFKRKEMDKDGFPLREENVLLGDLPGNLAYAAYLIYTLDMAPDKNTRIYKFKGVEFKGLNKNKNNDFLIERDGKKIKLNGQLWPSQFYDMDADTFRQWCANNHSIHYVPFPE